MALLPPHYPECPDTLQEVSAIYENPLASPGIEATTDTDAIRQAYILALLPSFHPETDPQGFGQLREAYENALQGQNCPSLRWWLKRIPIARG